MFVGEAETEAMRRAIDLSRQARTHPNPRVGAVLVHPSGSTIAEGHHRGPGRPHAERDALEMLSGPVPAGSTLVVTLEPCNHHGRTPPCTEAILAAGVQRVVVGMVDPDPHVSGAGVERLREEGVEVVTGVLADEVAASDPSYFHHRRTGRPLITLKSALTLDGQSAALDGTSRWITGGAAREDAHRLRSEADAVVIGAGTVRTDDPTLTVRLDDYDGPQPVAVVVKGRRQLPDGSRLWERPDTLIVATAPSGLPLEHLVVEPGPDGRPDPAQIALALADHGLLAVLVEGGASLARALWSAGLVDQGVTYLAGRIAGGAGLPMFGGHWETITDITEVAITATKRLGEDLRVEWSPLRE